MAEAVELYYWSIPDGWKITILLEELAQPYRVASVANAVSDKHIPEFIKSLPDKRIPVMIDYEPLDSGATIVLFEAGTILQYLAEKHGSFLPHDRRAKFSALQWLYWQAADEPVQLYQAMNNHLNGKDFLSGDYSVADMAMWPYIVTCRQHKQQMQAYPHLQRWYEKLRRRPAIVKAYTAGKEARA